MPNLPQIINMASCAAYMHPIINGFANESMRSAFVKSILTRSEAFENFCFS